MGTNGRLNADFATLPLGNHDELLGNEEAFEDGLKLIRFDGRPPKMSILGPSGSGKSTIINYLCGLAYCTQPKGTLHCGVCSRCRRFKIGHRETGLYSELAEDSEHPPIHYLPINCRNATPQELHKNMEHLRGTEGLRIIHLEEAAELRRLGCDVSLTDIMDDPDFQDCRWFMTAVCDSELDVQFRRRWSIKHTTSKPAEMDVAKLLAKRCRDYGIKVDHPGTLMEVARRSWCVVGRAASILSMSLLKDPPQLTREMVERYPFPAMDPWQQQFYAN